MGHHLDILDVRDVWSALVGVHTATDYYLDGFDKIGRQFRNVSQMDLKMLLEQQIDSECLTPSLDFASASDFWNRHQRSAESFWPPVQFWKRVF